MSCANALRDEAAACGPHEVGPIQREVYALANVGVTVGAGKSKVIQETLAKIKAASGLFADPAHIASHAGHARTARHCSWCNKEVGEFTDALSRKEYGISGMCQGCQDGAFTEPKYDAPTDAEGVAMLEDNELAQALREQRQGKPATREQGEDVPPHLRPDVPWEAT